MKFTYMAVWMLLTITTIFFLFAGHDSPLTIVVLFLLLLLLSLEAIWQVSFGESLKAKNNQVKNKNLISGGK